MTLKRKNNHFNEFVVIDLVENEVLHNKIILNFASHKFSAACSRGTPARYDFYK